MLLCLVRCPHHPHHQHHHHNRHNHHDQQHHHHHHHHHQNHNHHHHHTTPCLIPRPPPHHPLVPSVALRLRQTNVLELAFVHTCGFVGVFAYTRQAISKQMYARREASPASQKQIADAEPVVISCVRFKASCSPFHLTCLGPIGGHAWLAFGTDATKTSTR